MFWRKRVSSWLGIAGALLPILLLTTCTSDDLLAPGRVVQSQMNIGGLFAVGGGKFPITVDTVIVELRRVPDSTIAFVDTVPSSRLGNNGDSLIISVTLRLDTSPEDFYFRAIAKAGGITYYEASGIVRATAGQSTTTPPLTPTYVGPGAAADSLAFALDTTIQIGDSTLLTAVVLQGGAVLSGVPVGLVSSDTTRVKIHRPAALGLEQGWAVAAGTTYDSVTISALTPNGLIKAGRLRFLPRATALAKVSGDAQTISAGAAAPLPLVVQVLDGAGKPYRGHYLVRFLLTTGPPGTAVVPDTVRTDSLGLAQTILTAGSTTGGVTVTATAAGLTGSPQTFTETVNQATGPVASLVLTPDSSTVTTLGDSTTFTATCRDATPVVVPCTGITFLSLSPAIANVSAAGTAKALAPGRALIIAQSGNFADTSAFIVNTVSAIVITPADTIATAVGDTVRLSAAAVRFLGGSTPLANSSVVWQTLTPAVALVDTGGRVRVVAPGVATIQATNSGVSGTTTVRVVQTPASFNVTPDTAVIGIGGIVTLTAKTFDRRGYQIPGRAVSWVAHNSVAVIATVDTAGRVTGSAIGSVYVLGTDSSFVDSTRVDVVLNPPKNIQWGADSASVGRGTSFQQAILLSQPAPAAGVAVRIVSSDTNVLKPSQSLVTFPQGYTSQTVTFQGRAAGRVTVTATDTLGGYGPDTLIVGVLSTLEFRTIQSPTSQATSFYINSAEQRSILIFLSDPAPPGGLAVTVQPTTPGVATITPTTAIIPGGQLSVQVDLTGSAVGNSYLTPVAGGYVGKASYVNVALAQFTVSTSYYGTVGAGQYFQPYVSVPNSMDRPTLVSLTHKNALAGQIQDTVTIPTGGTYTYFRYTGLAPGLDTITASKSGWVSGSAPITVTTPRLYLSTSTGLTAGAPAVAWTAYTYDSLQYNAGYRADTLTVTVTSRDPSVISVVSGKGVVPKGQYYVSVSSGLLPVAGGSTYVVATAAGHIPDSVRVTVTPAAVSLSLGYPGQVGLRQQLTNNSVGLPFLRSVPVVVHLSHTNPTVGQLVPDSVVIPANSYGGSFAINALALGSDTVKAAATGYDSSLAQPYLVGTGRLVQSGLGSFYTTTSPAGQVRFYAYDPGGYTTHPVLDTVTVSASSGNPAVFTVDSPTVRIPIGQTFSGVTTITIRGPGTARLYWSGGGPGYSYPSDSSYVVTVTQPSLSVVAQYPSVVGVGQYQQYNYVSIPNPIATPLVVNLSHPGTVRGTVPASVTIPTGSTSVYFTWTGVAVGLDTVTATATGYGPASTTLTVGAAKLLLSGLPGTTIVNDTLTSLVYATDSIYAYYGYSHPVVDTVRLSVTSSDTNVLQVDPTFTQRIDKDQSSSPSFRIFVRGPGTARLRVSAPGYIADSTGLVVATAPAITINPSSLTLGTGQQNRFYYVQIPNGAAGTTKVAIARSDTSVAGVSSDTVSIPPGSIYSNQFTVYAKQKVASIQLTATAPGFTQGTSVLIVNTPKLQNSVGTTAYVGQPSMSFTTYTEDQTGTIQEVHDTITVTYSSTNPSVLTIDTATVRIPSSGHLNFAYNSYKPLAAGTAQIIASAPGYTSDASQAISVISPHAPPEISR